MYYKITKDYNLVRLHSKEIDTMKKIKPIALAFLIFSLSLTACSSKDVSSAIEQAQKIGHTVSSTVDIYEHFKDVEAHTEDEMKEFALEALEYKYGKEFFFTGDYFRYDHFFRDEGPMNLWARVAAADAPDLTFTVRIQEPNSISDNYEQTLYHDDVNEYLRTHFEENGLTGDISFKISCDLRADIPQKDMSVEEFLAKKDTEILFTEYVDPVSDWESYIPIIKKWIACLDTLDFGYQFNLKDRTHEDLSFYTCSSHDSGAKLRINDSDDDILEDIKSDTSFSMSHVSDEFEKDGITAPFEDIDYVTCYETYVLPGYTTEGTSYHYINIDGDQIPELAIITPANYEMASVTLYKIIGSIPLYIGQGGSHYELKYLEGENTIINEYDFQGYHYVKYEVYEDDRFWPKKELKQSLDDPNEAYLDDAPIDESTYENEYQKFIQGAKTVKG